MENAAITIIVTIVTRLAYTWACPIECICQKTIETSEKDHVTCVNQSLQSIPENIPATVLYLDLHGNNIFNLTNVFQNLPGIQILDLSFNKITILNILDFKELPNLKQFYLQNNGLEIITNTPLSYLQQPNIHNYTNNSEFHVSTISLELQNLESLNVAHNLITNFQSDTFELLGGLRYIDLANNNIRWLPNGLFVNLGFLQTINLAANKFIQFDGYQYFRESKNLKSLNLSHNELEDVSNLTFPSLESLDLSWNKLTTTNVQMFNHIHNLAHLSFNGNPISSIVTPIFSSLSNLQFLSLSHMPKLTYLSLVTFQGLDNLKHLQLHNNPLLFVIHKDLFVPLKSLNIVNLSYNSITSIHQDTLSKNTNITALDVQGYNFTCDCSIQWLIEQVQSNNSVLVHPDKLYCVLPSSHETVPLLTTDVDTLQCSHVEILNYSMDSAFKIGYSAILTCEATSVPRAEITWIIPSNRTLTYHNFNQDLTLAYLHLHEQQTNVYLPGKHKDVSYYSVDESSVDRIVVLADGSLYIDYVMRGDAGYYKCVAKNPRNSTEITINVKLDYTIVNDVKVWSYVVGFACASGFFLLNLIYSIALNGWRRCVSQRRRERIREMIENMDHYKTAQLTRIKENYNYQVGRISDQYHYQLGRLREHHQNQVNRMGRMREGASQKVEKIRENYNNQLGRLKDYSSSQLLQIRERYNSQIDKIRDYSSDKLDKFHEKYRMKQQHVLKLFEIMNLDNCRTVFESECVRTESIILQSEVFVSDVSIHSPNDSANSDSEYNTAAESSKHSSQVSVNELYQDNNGNMAVQPMNPYLAHEDRTSSRSDSYQSTSETIIDTAATINEDCNHQLDREHQTSSHISNNRHKKSKKHQKHIKQQKHSEVENIDDYGCDEMIAEPVVKTDEIDIIANREREVQKNHSDVEGTYVGSKLHYREHKIKVQDYMYSDILCDQLDYYIKETVV